MYRQKLMTEFPENEHGKLIANPNFEYKERFGKQIEDSIYKIDKLVEKPPLSVAPSNLAIMGRYVLTPDIFDHIENVEPGYGGEIQLTDALSKLDEIYGQVFKGESFDIGNRIDWLKTSLIFALEDENARDNILEFIREEII